MHYIKLIIIIIISDVHKLFVSLCLINNKRFDKQNDRCTYAHAFQSAAPMEWN